jgi:uncharacterized protein YbjQ (UPF0145 family)
VLSSQEFAAIGGVGFEPVGQAFGAAVYAAGDARGYSCPGAPGSAGGTTRAQPATQVSGRGDPGSFGPLVQAMYQARRTAIDRMTAECAALGGHGVVGVRLSQGSFSLGGLEFTAIGTAVRAPDAARGPRAPFTCGVSGQEFAKLIMTGWVPAGLAFGISIGSRHDDRATARQARWASGNVEVAGWTELVNESRHDARRRLEDEVRRFGAEGVVIAAMQMRVRAGLPGDGGPPRPHRGGDADRHRHCRVFPRRPTSCRSGPNGHVPQPAAPPGSQGLDIGGTNRT